MPACGQGVRLLAPGEEMLAEPHLPVDLPAVEQSAQALEKVTIASARPSVDDLSKLTRREAPFEIVPSNANPDLLWDPTEKTLQSGTDLFAAHAEDGDLPAMIDNFAVLRLLKKRFRQNLQPLAFLNPKNPKDTLLQVEAAGVAGRALTAFTLSSDGTLQMIFPRRAEPHVVKSASMVLNIALPELSGPVTLIVQSSSQPLDALDEALTEMPHYRASIEVLHLILTLAPQDVRFGSMLLSPQR